MSVPTSSLPGLWSHHGQDAVRGDSLQSVKNGDVVLVFFLGDSTCYVFGEQFKKPTTVHSFPVLEISFLVSGSKFPQCSGNWSNLQESPAVRGRRSICQSSLLVFFFSALEFAQ